MGLKLGCLFVGHSLDSVPSPVSAFLIDRINLGSKVLCWFDSSFGNRIFTLSLKWDLLILPKLEPDLRGSSSASVL